MDYLFDETQPDTPIRVHKLGERFLPDKKTGLTSYPALSVGKYFCHRGEF